MKTTNNLNRTLLLAGLLSVSFNVLAIQKCKDAEGNWHYGDNAQENCADTEVTNLDKRGFIKDRIDAPKTEEELLLEQEAKEKEAEELAKLEAEKAERERVLSIYEREEDIDRQRDNKLASVDGNIRVHKAYLKQMDKKVERITNKLKTANKYNKEKFETELAASKERIKEFSVELERLELQKKAIAERFANEKTLYREYSAKNE